MAKETLLSQITQHLAARSPTFRMVTTFPDGNVSFQRVDLLVAPESPLDVDDFHGLNQFKDDLTADFNPNWPMDQNPVQFLGAKVVDTVRGRQFWIEQSTGDLHLGFIGWSERLPAQLVTTTTTRVRITNRDLLEAARVAGVPLTKKESSAAKPLDRSITLRPYPSLRLAQFVADYEGGFFGGDLAYNEALLRLYSTIAASQLESLKAGDWPFPEPERLVERYASTPYQRAFLIEGKRAIEEIGKMTDEFFGPLK